MKKHITFYPNSSVIISLVLILFSKGILDLGSTCSAQTPWIQKADMPTARGAHGVGTVNGKIYAIGGNSSGSTEVEEYDPVTDNWITKTNMPTPRSDFSCCVVNGKIYAIGGWFANMTFSTVEEYDPETDTWTEKSPMPTTRWGYAPVMVDGKIYVIGGATGWPVDKIYGTYEIYDPVTDTWTTKGTIPSPRWMLSCCVMNGKIYAIGGHDNQGTVSTVEVYDPVTDTWAEKSPMPTARWGHGTAAVNGKIYAIGGGNVYPPTIAYRTVEEYDPVTDSWTTKSPMPAGRICLATCHVNGKIYAPGGGGILASDAYAELYVYDPHYDLLTLIEKVNVSRSYAKAGIDSVCIAVNITDPTGVTLFAEIEAPDQTPIDSLQLFDDGNHNDGNAGDSLYANVWPISSAEEQQYYVDLKVTRIDADTTIRNLNNMASFTSIGPITVEKHTFTGIDTIPNPGDKINFEITLRNNSSTSVATNIKTNISVSDTNVTFTQYGSRSYGDISPGETSTTSGYCRLEIDSDCPYNTEIPVYVEITSNGYTCWRDTFSIMVQEESVNIKNISEPVTRIYPNPTNDMLNIEISNTGKQGLEIEIFTVAGTLIYQKEYKKTNTYFAEQIDLSDYKKGIYLIKVRQADTVYVGKMVLK